MTVIMQRDLHVKTLHTGLTEIKINNYENILPTYQPVLPGNTPPKRRVY